MSEQPISLSRVQGYINDGTIRWPWDIAKEGHSVNVRITHPSTGVLRHFHDADTTGEALHWLMGWCAATGSTLEDSHGKKIPFRQT